MKNKLDGKALGLNIKLLTVRLAFLFEIKLLQLKKLPKASKAQTQKKKKIAKLGLSILVRYKYKKNKNSETWQEHFDYNLS